MRRGTRPLTAFSNKQSLQTIGSVLRIIARCRWFEEDLGSEVVFWFIAHVHVHSLLITLTFFRSQRILRPAVN